MLKRDDRREQMVYYQVSKLSIYCRPCFPSIAIVPITTILYPPYVGRDRDLHEPTNLHAPRQGRFEDTGRSRGLEPRLARHECVFPFREPYPCTHCALAC